MRLGFANHERQVVVLGNRRLSLIRHHTNQTLILPECHQAEQELVHVSVGLVLNAARTHQRLLEHVDEAQAHQLRGVAVVHDLNLAHLRNVANHFIFPALGVQLARITRSSAIVAKYELIRVLPAVGVLGHAHYEHSAFGLL